MSYKLILSISLYQKWFNSRYNLAARRRKHSNVSNPACDLCRGRFIKTLRSCVSRSDWRLNKCQSSEDILHPTLFLADEIAFLDELCAKSFEVGASCLRVIANPNPPTNQPVQDWCAEEDEDQDWEDAQDREDIIKVDISIKYFTKCRISDL